ncbi:MAG: hypothetical protein ACD_59C00131G0007 [uncultured bacterium]|nr:MAG: hypothetical protein ACD_59C00131G0007 [uncultured bacterium]
MNIEKKELILNDGQNRKDEIESYTKNLTMRQQALEKIKIEAQTIHDLNKKICVFAEVSVEDTAKQLKILRNIERMPIDDIPDTIWDEYKRNMNNNDHYSEFLNKLEKDIEDNQNRYGALTNSGQICEALISSSTDNMCDVLDSLRQNDDFTAYVDKSIISEKSWLKEYEHIKSFLYDNSPNLIKGFENIVEDRLSTKDDDSCYQYLLPLRSILVDQFLDIKCPKSSYCKAEWFLNYTKSRKRFFQMKYFIIDQIKETNLPSSSLQQINDIAEKFEKIYDEISEYGKKNNNVLSAVNCFKDLIVLFSSAIKNRIFFKF